MSDADSFRYHDLKRQKFELEMEILNKRKANLEEILKIFEEKPEQAAEQKVDDLAAILAYYESQMSGGAEK